MRLVRFPESRVDTAVQQLPEPDLVVDPRPNGWDCVYKFKVTVNGTTLTITRINAPENRDVPTGWDFEIPFRVYYSNEQRYSFDSRKYIYHGLEDERPPKDTTEVIIKDGVETIGCHAFRGCKSLVKLTIPKSVKRIEDRAFNGCKSLRFVQLPPNLEYIGHCAFYYCESLVKVTIPKSVKIIQPFAFGRCKSLRFIELPPNLECIGRAAFEYCTSLEAVYLPPTVTQIDHYAFCGCTSLRILNIPDSVEDIELDVIYRCESLLTEKTVFATGKKRIKWLRNRYNLLHNLCCQPSPSPQAIQQLPFIQGHNRLEVRTTTNDKPQFKALHLLAANPSVTSDMITAYLQLAPDVATMQDSIRMTPLHMLCSLPQFSYGTGSAIRVYFGCNEGKEAAFMTDSQGKTPFQYLCEKSFDDMPFLKNKSFGGLFCWWYDGLEINLFTEGFVAENNENTKIRKWKCCFWW